MALYGPRVTIAVELAGTWGKFGGFGSRVCQLVERLVARARDHIEVMALAHPARVITKPGRDRNTRQQLRAMRWTSARSTNGAARVTAGNPASRRSQRPEMDPRSHGSSQGGGTEQGPFARIRLRIIAPKMAVLKEGNYPS